MLEDFVLFLLIPSSILYNVVFMHSLNKALLKPEVISVLARINRHDRKGVKPQPAKDTSPIRLCVTIKK